MKTKDRILEVAREMIAESGYHSTTTAQLAAKAGISEGTIYRHFESKEDILVTILDEVNERYSEFLSEQRGADVGTSGTLERVLAAHFRFVAENLHGIKIVLSSYALLSPSRQSMNTVIDRMRAFTAQALSRSMELGVIREVDPDKTAMVLVALLLGLLELRLFWPEIQDIGDEATRFARHALTTAL